MARQIQFRRGLESQWTSVNPVLAEGEMGLALDASKFKLGDGVKSWNQLAYASAAGSVDWTVASTNAGTDISISTGAATNTLYYPAYLTTQSTHAHDFAATDHTHSNLYQSTGDYLTTSAGWDSAYLTSQSTHAHPYLASNESHIREINASNGSYWGGTVGLLGSGNITVSASADGNVIFSVPAQSTHSHDTYAGISHNHGSIYTSQITGSVLTAASVSSGITLGIPAWLTTAATGGNGGDWATSAITGSGISILTGAATNTLQYGPFITTYTQSTHSHVTYAATDHTHGSGVTASTAGSELLFTTASNSWQLGVPKWITTTPAQSVQPVAVEGTNGSYNFSTLKLVTGNGASFYTDASGVRLSYTVPAIPGATVFSNSNNINFGINGSTVTASATGLALSGHTHSDLYLPVGNSTQWATSVLDDSLMALSYSSAFQTATLASTFAQTANIMNTSERVNYFYTSNNTFANNTHAHGGLTINVTNLSTSITSASNGLTINLSAANPGAGGGVAVAGSGASTVTSGTMQFANSNAVSFGLSGSTMTASIPIGTVNFSDAGGITWSSSVGAGASSVSTSIYVGSISFPNLSWSLVGNNTSGTTVSNAGSLYLSGGNNVTLSGNNNTIIISAGAGGGGVAVAGSGASTVTSGTMQFANLNNVSFGLNGSTMTASIPNYCIGFYEPYIQSNSSAWVPGASTWIFAPFVAPECIGGGVLNILINNTSTAGICRFFTGAIQSNSTGGKNQSFTQLISAALYSQGAGANSTRLESFWGNTFSYGLTNRISVSQSGANSSVSASAYVSISYIYDYDSLGATSASQFVSSNFSNGTNTSMASDALDTVGVSVRNMISNNFVAPIAFNTTIQPGNYWLGVMHYTSHQTATSGTSFPGASALIMSNIHLQALQRAAFAAYRRFGRTVSNGTDNPFFIQGGVYTAQSAVAPTVIRMQDVRTTAGNLLPYFNFERRGSAMYV